MPAPEALQRKALLSSPPEPATSAAKAIVNGRDLRHTEDTSHDAQLRKQAGLRHLKLIRRAFGPRKVDLCQRCEFLSIAGQHVAEPAAALERQLAILEDVYFESAQQRGRRQQFVELRNARVNHFKTACRFQGRESLSDSELLIELLVTGGAAIRQ